MSDELLTEVDELRKQAAFEKSHYYVASVLGKVSGYILDSEEKLIEKDKIINFLRNRHEQISNMKLELEISKLKLVVKLLEKSNEFYGKIESWCMDELTTSQWSDCINDKDVEKINTDYFGGKLAREIKLEVKEIMEDLK